MPSLKSGLKADLRFRGFTFTGRERAIHEWNAVDLPMVWPCGLLDSEVQNVARQTLSRLAAMNPAGSAQNARMRRKCSVSYSVVSVRPVFESCKRCAPGHAIKTGECVAIMTWEIFDSLIWRRIFKSSICREGDKADSGSSKM